jgi:hypothetical protein
MIKPTQMDESFMRIYQAYRHTVFGIAFNYTKSNADADDGLITEGYYSCAIEFEGFDYENAQKVEIRFGDEVIVLK